MAHDLLVPFPGPDGANRKQVGGKGASLSRMSAHGLRVPPGVVLTTRFFASWFDAVTATALWARILETPTEQWTALCTELKELALALPMSEIQLEALAEVQRSMTSSDGLTRLAVRSSSPDEDLAAASFAGGYETQLGVPPGALEDAVRTCFASSLDARVLTYKRAHGFDVGAPSIAVIVQQQVASEISGVGFSVNPVTNDYDEAVIDANWGLGTTVVDGRISPDHFVVDKVRHRVIEAVRGDKKTSIWLDPDHGTIERANDAPDERTLTDDQLVEITETVTRIEALYEMPMDVEWAYADGRLHVLQARPITTYVPLPPEMLTDPGRRRHLYADAALSKGLTINAPISPLGLDNMKSLFGRILESSAGLTLADTAPEDALVVFAGGRMYANYSNILWLASARLLAKNTAPTDALMAEILAGVDAETYRSATKPSWLSARLVGIVARMLWRLRGVMLNVLRALFVPDEAFETYERTVDDVAADLRQQLDDGLPLEVFRRTFEPRMAVDLFEVMMPALMVGLIPPENAAFRGDEETKALAAELSLGVEGNVVVDMGIELYKMAQLIDAPVYDDLDALAERIEQRRMPAPFLEAWDAFLRRYGWRGPQEMDLASPRYADDPRLALRQMSYMAGGNGTFDPAVAHRRQVERRDAAYHELLQRLDPVRGRMLRWIYRRTGRFADTRDTPKHLIVLYNYVVRRRALERGRRLEAAGRLDAAEHVFDLTYEDLAAAETDASLDLRARRDERTRFYDKLKAHVKRFPPVIDSRGRILRPSVPDDEASGVLKGMPVSSGVVTGPVKVLHTADEKPIEQGDVLVAYTTDPGWTPLFVNAAAIVLEVGGVLQHGAVVAREYGKPCVVGIDRVTSKLEDGDVVEIDGSAGVIRRMS